MGGGLRWTPGHRENLEDRRFEPPAERAIADGVDGHRLTERTAMKLPPRIRTIIRTLYEQHRDLAAGTDDQRRRLVLLIAQQTAFEFGLSWGTKRADPGRPPSKDAIAQQQPDGRLFAWDLINGTTRVPFEDPDSIDITGQTFMPVPPQNHLGSIIQQPPAEPPGPGPLPPAAGPPELALVLEAIGRLERRVHDFDQQLAVLSSRLGLGYSGTVRRPYLGTGQVELTPKE